MRKISFSGLLSLALILPSTAALADGHTSEYVGNKGYVGAVESYGAKGYVPAATYRPAAVRHTYKVRRKAVRVVAVPPCPPGYSGMYRGTLYCLDGQLLH